MKVKTSPYNAMKKKTAIADNAKDPWVSLPSLRFEYFNYLDHSKLISQINQQVRDSMYTHTPTWKIPYIWTQFERLINSIFHDLRIIVDEETSEIISIGTLHAMQPKWLVLCEMMESVNTWGYTECHIFADRADLFLFYGKQAEKLVAEALKYIDYIYGNGQLNNLSGAKDINIEDWPVEILYSGLFKNSIIDESVENCNIFIKSMERLPTLLRDCAYSQTYYLFKNTLSLYNNVDSFQQQELGIYCSRRKRFIQDYYNALQTLARRKVVVNPENSPVLREQAFLDTMHKSYSEVYQLYESNRSMLESLKDSIHTDEGWLRTFFTNLFQTHYTGEQRDAEGIITKVFVDERGNTSIEGKSGWERWLDLLTVISLNREYEQKYQSIPQKEHQIMKWACEKYKDKVRLLLEQLENFRDERSSVNEEIDKYEFNLKVYKKKQIFVVFKEMRSCLNIGKREFGQYLLDNTNLGVNTYSSGKRITLNVILNQI